MLQRRVTEDGITYYASPLLEQIGVPHAFSTRLGGTSPPPFDSMNLGNPSGCAVQDDYARIYENYRRLQGAIGCGARTRCWVHQVHGGAVAVVRREAGFECGAKADALVSDDPARVMAVRVADCVPILMASKDGAVVAAVHAGWRGVIAAVTPAALRAMIDLRPALESAKLIAAIGPCISLEHFEVGPEVLEQFQHHFGAQAPLRRTSHGKGRVDLRQAIRLQLLSAGVPKDQIDTTDRCSYRDSDEFFSHRRDQVVTGRMAAIISAH